MQYLKIKKECPKFKMWFDKLRTGYQTESKNNHLEKKREDRALHRTHMRAPQTHIFSCFSTRDSCAPIYQRHIVGSRTSKAFNSAFSRKSSYCHISS